MMYIIKLTAMHGVKLSGKIWRDMDNHKMAPTREVNSYANYDAKGSQSDYNNRGNNTHGSVV